MTKTGDGDRSKGVQSIENGFGVVRALLAAGGPVALKRLAEMAAMSASKTHTYLVSFRRVGLVSQIPETGQYQLGPLAAELGVARLAQQTPVKIAERAIHHLRERGAEGSLFISIWSERGPVIVLRDEGHSVDVPFDIRVGYHSSLPFTATGNVFLAYLHPPIVAPVLELERGERKARGGALPLPSAEELQEIQERVRRDGYAVMSRLLASLTGIAIPIIEQDRLGAVMTMIVARPPTDVSIARLRRDMQQAVEAVRAV